MKIALVGSKNYDSIEYHMNDSLTYLGHDVFQLDINDVLNIPYRFSYYISKLSNTYDSIIFNKLGSKILDFKPELIICTYRFINPDFIRKIKKNLPNALIIHINPDALTTFEYQQIFVSPYDAYFTKDHYIVDFMRNKMNLNSFYLPEAFNHRIHKLDYTNRVELEEKINIDVISFGTLYPYRSVMLSELIKSGIDVSIYGTIDKRFSLPEINRRFKNEFLVGKRKAEVLCGSKIVFNNFHFAEIESANVKFFEINGIGGFQICDFRPVLREYTNIPLEKFTYTSIFEAIDLVKFYINNRQQRHDIAELQRSHFVKNHTYDIRMTQLLDQL